MNPVKVDFTKKQLESLNFAIKAHGTQRRKGTHGPYILHPMEVAYLVGLYYPDEHDIIIAGYLHDTLEDTDITFESIQECFGNEVANLVLSVTHISPPSFSWREHRELQIQNILWFKPSSAILKAADMLSNATSIARDFRLHGMKAFAKFKSATHADYVWYYESAHNALKYKLGKAEPILDELALQINEWRWGNEA